MAGRNVAGLDRFRRTLRLQANGLVGDGFRKHHAAVARRALAEAQAAQTARFGQPLPYRRIVDHREGVSEDAVRLYGVIEYKFSMAADVAGEIYAMILQASPVGPAKGGHYRDDHIILVNGEQVADLRSVQAGDEIAITNLRPYARKIEGGARESSRRRLTNRRPGLSVQAPNGVYEITAHAARQRFGNMAAIEFTYRGFAAGGAPISGRKGNVSGDRYPTIIIRPR